MTSRKSNSASISRNPRESPATSRRQAAAASAAAAAAAASTAAAANTSPSLPSAEGGSGRNTGKNVVHRRSSPSAEHDLLEKFMKRDQEQQRHHNASALLIKSTSSTTMLTTETKASTITMPMSNTSTPAARERRMLNEASWMRKPAHGADSEGRTATTERATHSASGDRQTPTSVTTSTQSVESSTPAIGNRPDPKMLQGWQRDLERQINEKGSELPPFQSPKAVTEEDTDVMPKAEQALLKKSKKKREKLGKEKTSRKAKSSKKSKKKQSKLSESLHENSSRNHGSSQELDPFDPASSAQWGSSANTFGTTRTSSNLTGLTSSGATSSSPFSPNSPITNDQQELDEHFEHFLRIDQMEANRIAAERQHREQDNTRRESAADSKTPRLFHSEPASKSWRANKKEQRMIANLPPARTPTKAPSGGSASVTSDIDSIAEPPSVDERNTPGYMASTSHQQAWATSQKALSVEHQQRKGHNQGNKSHTSSPDDFLGVDSSHSKANSSASRATVTSLGVVEPPRIDELPAPIISDVPNRNIRPNGTIKTTESHEEKQAKQRREEQMWQQVAQLSVEQIAADASVASGSIMEPPSVEERITPQAMLTPEPPEKILTVVSSRRNLSNTDAVVQPTGSLPRGSREHHERRKMDKAGLAAQHQQVQQHQQRGPRQSFTVRVRQSAPGRYSSKQQLRMSSMNLQQFRSERRRSNLREMRKSHSGGANSAYEHNSPSHHQHHRVHESNTKSPPPTDHRYSHTISRINPDGSETWKSTPPTATAAMGGGGASGRSMHSSGSRDLHESHGSDGYNEPSYVSQHHRHRAEQRKGSKSDSPPGRGDDGPVEQMDESMNLEDVFPNASFTTTLRSSSPNTQQLASDTSLSQVGAVAYTGHGYRDDLRSTDSDDGTKSAVSVEQVIQADMVGSQSNVVQGAVLSNLDHDKEREDKLFYRRYCRIVVAFVFLGIVVGIVVPVVVKPSSKDAPTREPLSGAPSEAPSASSFPSTSPTFSPTGIAWEDFLPVPLVGSAGQELGSALSFVGDVLAVGSAGGSGLVEVFQVDRETHQLESLGSPLEVDSDMAHGIIVKVARKGDLLAVAIPSGSNSTIGKVQLYRRDNESDWFLHAQLDGEDSSFGTSMDLTESGDRLVVASNTIARAYDLTADQPLQLGSDRSLLRGTGFPTIVTISDTLLGIGQVLPGRGSPCIQGCDDRALVGLFQYDGTDWIDAPSPFAGPNTLSDSGPFHDIGTNKAVVALAGTRDAVRVFKFNPTYASFIREGNAIPLGREIGVQETIYLDFLKDSHVAVAWDRQAAVYDLAGQTWVQRGEIIQLDPDVTPVVAISGDGELLAVGLDEAGTSRTGHVRIYRLSTQ